MYTPLELRRQYPKICGVLSKKEWLMFQQMHGIMAKNNLPPKGSGEWMKIVGSMTDKIRKIKEGRASWKYI